MPHPTVPFDDAARVAALRRYGVLDDPVVADLDAVVRVAATICEAPMAGVNLTDEDRVVMPCNIGGGNGEVPREWGMCEPVIRSGRLFHTDDLPLEPAWREHLLAQATPAMARMYASAPLITPDGHAIGTICVMDPASRRLADRQLAALQDLADTAMHLFEARVKATELNAALGELVVRSTHDALTGVANRDQLTEALRHNVAAGTPHTVLFCDLDRFKPINDRYGHLAGDQVLAAIGSRLRAATRPDDLVVRTGGDEFVVVVPGVNPSTAAAVAARIESLVEKPIVVEGGARVTVGISIGWATSEPSGDPAQLLARADRMMYEVKAARHGLDAAER